MLVEYSILYCHKYFFLFFKLVSSYPPEWGNFRQLYKINERLKLCVVVVTWDNGNINRQCYVNVRDNENIFGVNKNTKNLKNLFDND